MSLSESELLHAHRALNDGGIPARDNDGVAISLAVRVGLLIDERNSLKDELEALTERVREALCVMEEPFAGDPWAQAAKPILEGRVRL